MGTSKSTSREHLPYRRNCEGYLLYGDDKVLAQDTGKGYILFPGGGVDEGESPFDKKRHVLIFADISRFYEDEHAIMPMRKELIEENEKISECPENLAKLLTEAFQKRDCTPPT